MLDKITQLASYTRFGSFHQKFYIQKFKIYAVRAVIKGFKYLVASHCEHKKQMAIEFLKSVSRIEKRLLIIKAADFNY